MADFFKAVDGHIYKKQWTVGRACSFNNSPRQLMHLSILKYKKTSMKKVLVIFMIVTSVSSFA
ncbi:MAG: hypothetical protein WKF91_22955, partial [Segetibacter sp.]